ncbi:hydroxylamine reductase [Deltaproteobacteria bacterium Smac51]|nr:hydroxylamine reductase [Deltaproteobacteria bacterium Smac51]
MFCWQCEQTKSGLGCDVAGVCGKKPDVAALQDLLLFMLKGLGQAAKRGRVKGLISREMDRFTVGAVFATLTNVDFDPARFQGLINQAAAYRNELKKSTGLEYSSPALNLEPAGTIEGLVEQGKQHGLKDTDNDLVLSMRETAVYGLKGLCAYADHAAVLGHEVDELYKFVHECLAATLDASLTLDDWLGLAIKVGEMNLKAMELLDAANTGTYGHPTPIEVPLGFKAGKAILVSGHDLKDLAMLLEQTAGKGINIYTHGEMLPCHGYPELKKHPHFYGHYGTAWQNQAKEFPAFPGSILFTTNCIQKPAAGTEGNIFTTGQVGWPGLTHIAARPDGSKDFGPVIEKALAMPGFAADEDKGSVLAGFGRQAVLSVAGKVIELVKAGKIRRFMLVGGCDGAKPGRNYYTDLVAQAPKDTIILTLACGKFRFFDQKLGDIDGIPRLLDIGQCNDAYSAIKIALALAEAFDCGVNDLPLSLILSWYEQKACAILLTLLYLGIKNIKLGPTLPAFIHPDILNVLVEKFALAPITTPEDDLKQILS